MKIIGVLAIQIFTVQIFTWILQSNGNTRDILAGYFDRIEMAVFSGI